MAKDKKNYALRVDGEEVGVYTGRQPRQAALKAANRGYSEIRLREHGTKKVHVFEGGREKVDAPEDRPDWMPEQIWKPWVKKQGIEHLDDI